MLFFKFIWKSISKTPQMQTSYKKHRIYFLNSSDYWTERSSIESIVQFGTINIPIDGERWEREDIVSDNEILLLVGLYLKMAGKGTTLTHFGELCKWNLVQSNSPQASLIPLFLFRRIKFGVNITEARKVEREFVRVDFHSNLVCEEFAKL